MPVSRDGEYRLKGNDNREGGLVREQVRPLDFSCLVW